jgi:hypothetical protein
MTGPSSPKPRPHKAPNRRSRYHKTVLKMPKAATTNGVSPHNPLHLVRANHQQQARSSEPVSKPLPSEPFQASVLSRLAGSARRLVQRLQGR